MYIFYFCQYILSNMSQEENAKQYVIEAVVYDDEHGYGSKTNTL